MPLTSDEARRLIEAAHKRAGEIGIRVCVAIVDEGGLLQALQRMDGAPPLSAQIAECKANGAALTLRDGAAMAQLHQERPAFFALVSGLPRGPAVRGLGRGRGKAASSVRGALGVRGGKPGRDPDGAGA